MWSTRADGGGKPSPLTQSKEFQYPSAFSPDGKHLAFYQVGQQGLDLWTTPVERDVNGLQAGKPKLFQHTLFGARGASFSPDGRWIAYNSSESGTPQIYVRAFSDQGGRWQISSNGGTSPIFSHNGKELFFYDVADDRIMAAGYSVNGDSFVAEKPRVWAEKSVAMALSAVVGAQYDVAPDGNRIAVATYSSASPAQDAGRVIFLENFADELQRKLPLQGN